MYIYMIHYLKFFLSCLTLLDMEFFEPSVMEGGGGGGHEGPHHNFVIIAPMIMKFGKVSILMYSTQW